MRRVIGVIGAVLAACAWVASPSVHAARQVTSSVAVKGDGSVNAHANARANDVECAPTSQPEERCTLPFAKIHPTQFSIGQKWVDKKKADLSAGRDEKKGKVIVGPGGVFYLVDRHHEARAIFELGGRAMLVKIVANWQSEPRFWQKMVSTNNAFLYDQTGAARSPEQLPATVAQLVDDPFRSLGAFAREAGCYIKDPTNPNFAEFYWGQFFRTNGVQIAADDDAQMSRSMVDVRSRGLCGCDSPAVRAWLSNPDHRLPGCPK